jgi:iduronate 2-sulfatase
MVSRSQHGWNLGEFDIWCKMTNFELGTRVPLIISAPWLTASKGQRSMALAEAVDLYPTLSELAMGAGQLPTGKAGEYLGGASLAPIFKDISVKVKNVSLSQFSRCECLFPPRLLFSLVWLLALLL